MLPAMLFCPKCAKDALAIATQLELSPIHPHYDERTAQVVACGNCGFTCLATYKERRWPTERVWHTGYLVSEEQVKATTDLIAKCPDRLNRSCDCAVHRKIGGESEVWDWPAELDPTGSFEIRVAPSEDRPSESKEEGPPVVRWVGGWLLRLLAVAAVGSVGHALFSSSAVPDFVATVESGELAKVDCARSDAAVKVDRDLFSLVTIRNDTAKPLRVTSAWGVRSRLPPFNVITEAVLPAVASETYSILRHDVLRIERAGRCIAKFEVGEGLASVAVR